MRLRSGIFALLLPMLMAAAGCHSYHVETTVVNRTGQTIQTTHSNSVHSAR